MSLADLSTIIWRERETLELLLFKLDEEQMLLATGRTRWLAHATREVEVVLDQIRQTEVLRAAVTERVALQLKLGPNPSLSALAEAAPPPWNDLLRDHRKAFLAMTAEISSLAEANRDLLTAGQRATREAVLAVTDSVETYGPTGTTTAANHSARLVDEAL